MSQKALDVVDGRLEEVKAWLAGLPREFGLDAASLEAASADASFRRYFRVRAACGTAIVMDAPPPRESVGPFCRIDGMLRAAGLHAPEILARDERRGFLLLTDLGRKTYLQEFSERPELLAAMAEENAPVPKDIDAMMRAGIRALIAWQRASRPGVLPEYDEATLRREMGLFPEWYVGRHLKKTLSPTQGKILGIVFERIVERCLAQPKVYVHRDWMPRNLMVSDPLPGVLDFQDALYGPVTYDIVSMMRDAFWSWPEPWVLEWTIRYWEAARDAGVPVHRDFGAFWEDFEWMGVQRHLKVMGIFARINYRDGKPKYLADTPRFERYIRDVAGRYDGLRPLLRVFNELEGIKPRYGYTY